MKMSVTFRGIEVNLHPFIQHLFVLCF